MSLTAAILLAGLPLFATLDPTPREIRAAENGGCSQVMVVPAFACARGSATASVREIQGATYEWTIEGGTIAGGAGTSRVNVVLTDAKQAKLTCRIVAPACTTTATGVIAVREPLVLGVVVVPQSADVDDSVTISWSYEGEAQPASQLLITDALPAPVKLAASARSHTFVPESSGAKTIEILGSYAPAIVTAPSGGKRRAVGSTVRASACPDARATAKLDVRGCVLRPRVIDAPARVAAGATFTARVQLQAAGEMVRWTVTNGTAETLIGPVIDVRAGEEGEVGLSVRVERDTCFTEASTTVTVRREADCPVLPTARVELVNNSCNGGTIQATFTGTPPFFGTWSDGTNYQTNGETLTRDVTTPGEYTIRSVSDASFCEGTVSGSALVVPYSPQVTLETEGGACSTGRIIARFAGTPPFSGRWSNGDSFTTSDHELVLDAPNPGNWFIDRFQDGRCPQQFTSSNRIEIGRAPVVSVPVQPLCHQFETDPPWISVSFDSGSPPFTVEWSDGAITQSNSHSFSRKLPFPDTLVTTHEVVRASSGNCSAAVLADVTGTVLLRMRPVIDRATYDSFLCPGQIGTATLKYAVAPEATLTWSLDHGEILSGQGTPTVTYRGSGSLYVEATYAESFCPMRNSLEWVRVPGEPKITNVRFESPTIRRGGTSILRFTKQNVASFRAILPPGLEGNLESISCPDDQGRQCAALYTDSTHPSVLDPVEIPIRIVYTGECSPYEQEVTTSLWVFP
jgi:hypothetical protein